MKVLFSFLALSSIAVVSGQTPTPTPPAAPRQAQEAKPERPAGDTLSEAQRSKLREATDKLRQEQTPHSEKLRNARNELEALMRRENYDESAIRAKALEIGRIEGELAVIRAKHYKDLRGILPKEQFERMVQNVGTSTDRRLNSIVARTNAAPVVRPAPPQPGAPPAEKK
jgi:Spy/CpxP family protein refolding chaperone